MSNHRFWTAKEKDKNIPECYSDCWVVQEITYVLQKTNKNPQKHADQLRNSQESFSFYLWPIFHSHGHTLKKKGSTAHLSPWGAVGPRSPWARRSAWCRCCWSTPALGRGWRCWRCGSCAGTSGSSRREGPGALWTQRIYQWTLERDSISSGTTQWEGCKTVGGCSSSLQPLQQGNIFCQWLEMPEGVQRNYQRSRVYFAAPNPYLQNLSEAVATWLKITHPELQWAFPFGIVDYS